MGRNNGNADADFITATYRTILGGDKRKTVNVTMSDADGRSRVLVANTNRRLVTYAVKGNDRYVTRYDMPSFSFTGKHGPAYYVSQDDRKVLRVYQVLSSSSTDSTLLFTSKLPHMIRPLLLVDNNGKLTLFSNVPYDEDDVSVDDGVCTATGFLYAISIDVMSGKWDAVFVSNGSLLYSLLGVRRDDGECGVLIANINETDAPLRPIPTSFKEIPSFVNEKPPKMGDVMNIPFGLSIYSPSDDSLGIVPISGRDDWHVTGIDIEPYDGDANIIRVRITE